MKTITYWCTSITGTGKRQPTPLAQELSRIFRKSKSRTEFDHMNSGQFGFGVRVSRH